MWSGKSTSKTKILAGRNALITVIPARQCSDVIRYTCDSLTDNWNDTLVQDQRFGCGVACNF